MNSGRTSPLLDWRTLIINTKYERSKLPEKIRGKPLLARVSWHADQKGGQPILRILPLLPQHSPLLLLLIAPSSWSVFSAPATDSLLPLFDGGFHSSTATVSSGFPFLDILLVSSAFPRYKKEVHPFESSLFLSSFASSHHSSHCSPSIAWCFFSARFANLQDLPLLSSFFSPLLSKPTVDFRLLTSGKSVNLKLLPVSCLASGIPVFTLPFAAVALNTPCCIKLQPSLCIAFGTSNVHASSFIRHSGPVP